MKRECSSGYCGKKDCRFFAKWCSTRFKKGFTPQSMGCGCKKGEKTCPNGACVRDGGCCPDESCEGCGYCCPTKTKINFICCKGKTNKCIPDWECCPEKRCGKGLKGECCNGDCCPNKHFCLKTNLYSYCELRCEYGGSWCPSDRSKCCSKDKTCVSNNDCCPSELECNEGCVEKSKYDGCCPETWCADSRTCAGENLSQKCCPGLMECENGCHPESKYCCPEDTKDPCVLDGCCPPGQSCKDYCIGCC
mmetsp:Transcript_7266/g.10407  ORF Transcript_7266/g.10407 Transcript_7266/m.10407 type:complete len:249 (-) Transcript_7266:263-1009(-)